MDIKELSKQEYIARINKVMDYVGQSLDKSIDLLEMASVASFSAYHFHRIFSFFIGETPNNFVSRIRLEKGIEPSTLYDLIYNESTRGKRQRGTLWVKPIFRGIVPIFLPCVCQLLGFKCT